MRSRAVCTHMELVSRSQTASSPPFLYTDVIGRGGQYIKMEGRKRSGYARLTWNDTSYVPYWAPKVASRGSAPVYLPWGRSWLARLLQYHVWVCAVVYVGRYNMLDIIATDICGGDCLSHGMCRGMCIVVCV